MGVAHGAQQPASPSQAPSRLTRTRAGSAHSGRDYTIYVGTKPLNKGRTGYSCMNFNNLRHLIISQLNTQLSAVEIE